MEIKQQQQQNFQAEGRMCSNTQVEREHGNSTEGTRPKDKEREGRRQRECVCVLV